LANRNTIRVSEFERLFYDDKKPFKEKHWQALCRYLENTNKKGEKRIEYFRILNKGIQFTNYVGVIQAGNLTIEVLPKTDRQRTTAANLSVDELERSDNDASKNKQRWHAVLLQMLKECRLLHVAHVDYANLNLKSNSILDIYFELFLAHAEKLLHEGLVKKYKKVEGNQLAMKGQLVFAKNISRNLVHKERFYVRYTEYNRENIFNQLLYKTLCLIPSLSSNPFFSDRVNRLSLDFPEMPDCEVSVSSFDKLVYDRKTERYKEAVLICKMLLLNYRPDITGGSENVMAILFDMNELWEEFVYRRLKKEESLFGIKVQRQQSAHFWESDLMYRPKTIRPDVVITKDEQVIVLDTKWKISDDMIPADDDLKQMFTYNLFWNCDKSVLLYPANQDKSNQGSYHDFRKEAKYYTKCAVETVSVLDENHKLDKELGRRILQKIIL
jgi:5-methylcytosine-specific restriction enzyme subunit McrC